MSHAEDQAWRGSPESPRLAWLIPSWKASAEVPQGPVVLEVGRLVQQPGRRPARPAVGLEVVLVVEEALEERLVPALVAQSARRSAARPRRTPGDTTRGTPGRPSSRRCSSPPSGWASSRARAGRSTRPAPPCAGGRRRPSRRAAGRTGGPSASSRAVLPSQPGAQPSCDPAVLVVGQPVEDRPVPVGQPVIVALVLRQAVAVHLGQEAEVVGQCEVPDRQADRQAKAIGARGSSVSVPWHVPAGASCGRRARRAGSGLGPGRGCSGTAPSGTIGSGKGPRVGTRW